MHRVTGDHAGAKKSFSVDPVDRDQIDIMDIHSAWYFVAELVPMGIYYKKSQATLRKIIEIHKGTCCAHGYVISQLQFDRVGNRCRRRYGRPSRPTAASGERMLR